MNSNFEFLKENFPVLAKFGEQAEKYLYNDSNSCLMKLGMIGETIVNLIFTYDRIPLPRENTAVKRIDVLFREGLISRDLADILHALRKIRNWAVHENYTLTDEVRLPRRGLRSRVPSGYASVDDGKALIQMTHSLSEWFMQTYGDWNYQNQPFVMPEKNMEFIQDHGQKEQDEEEKLIEAAAKAAREAPAVAKNEREKRALQAAGQKIVWTRSPPT